MNLSRSCFRKAAPVQVEPRQCLDLRQVLERFVADLGGTEFDVFQVGPALYRWAIFLLTYRCTWR